VRIHPRSQALQDLAASLSQEQRELVKHLAGCERCRRRFEEGPNGPSHLAERMGQVLPWSTRPEGDYGPVITSAERRLQFHARALAAERAEAPRRLAELLEQPPERREMLLRNHPHFQTWGLLERLLDHTQEQCFGDPLAAESLSRLALCLTDVLDVYRYGDERIEDMRARAWSYVANSLRIRFELRQAEKAFETAFDHLRQGTGDSLEQAMLLDLQASLLRAQRRLSEAERLLLRALRTYRELGETHRVGRALISMTTVHEQAGTPEKSIPLLYDALKLIDRDREPRLLWTAHHNLITVLADVGRFMEAQRLFIQARPLYAKYSDGYVLNRRQWVAGKIARGLGQTGKAEAHLQAAREGFTSEGRISDAAAVSLDLASLFAEQRKTAELKQIAEETLAIYSSQQVEREALAAFSFLRQAALAERANLEVVAGVANFFKRLQHDPDLVFVQPAHPQ
jgi:tetratricopeptide (TPR) repeat protein